jgi:DNA-binding transcriptional LysR family regulator
MQLRDLTYVLAAATTGNFGRAAEFLGLQPSTVSRRMALLENELGLTLFERGPGGVRLTAGGRILLPHVRRALADLDAIRRAGTQSGLGSAGKVRLGIRMPPIGAPLQHLLSGWHAHYPGVVLTMSELSDQDIAEALEERRLDAALVPSHAVWPRAHSVRLYRERLVAAVPRHHRLAANEFVDWSDLLGEIVLVQGWDESQTAREFYASFLGSGARFQHHPASKQSILALVGADYGVTLATASQAQVTVPGVVYKQISEPNAWLQMDLVSLPELEEPTVGRFLAYLRDETRSLHLAGP